MLLAGAGLLIRSFWNLQQVDAGFRAGGVLKAQYKLPATRYPASFRDWPNFKEQHAFTQAVLERVTALPGVSSAAVAGNHPLDPGFTNSFSIVGREAEARTWPEISVRRVSPGYFTTVGLPLVRGRLLREADATTSPPVVLINEAAARRFFASGDPIGARMRFWGTARTIVGVVGDERIHGVTEAAPIAAYAPLSQAPSTTGVLLLRTSIDPVAAASAAQQAIHDVDPALAVFAVEPLQQTLSRSVLQRRFTMLLLGTFAVLALVLAAIGIHGLLGYSVERRRQEIGVRMALGAGRRAVVGLFARDAALVIGFGLMCGLLGAVALTRLLRTMLFGISPTDPLTFAVVVLVLGAVGGVAMLIPVRRAARVNPLAALRSE